MKGISSNGIGQGSARNSSRATAFPWKATLAALAAVALLAGLSGCASARGGSSDFEPGQYNPNTGYPAVGGGVPWHM